MELSGAITSKLTITAFLTLVFTCISIGGAFCTQCFAADENGVHLTILHTNDTHGFLTPFDTMTANSVGGAAGRAALINEIRRSNEEAGPRRHTLLLDAGDILENNAMSNFFKGEADIEFMNLVKYDALSFGNHEFGFGMDNFLALEKKATFPVLCANLLDAKSGEYLFKPYIIKEFDGVRIAIFGLTSHTLFYNSTAADLKRIKFVDKNEAYAKILPEMKEKSDYIIFLSHLGIEEDREFAKAHPELNIIIGSHSHTFLEQPEKVGEIYIFQAGKYGECLGRINLTFKDRKVSSMTSRLINIADRAAGDLVKKYKDQLDPQLDVKLGDLGATLDNLSKYELPTPLFDFVLKILYEHTKADFAMETAASITGRLDAGPIHLRNIFRIMPYNNFVVIIKLSGAEVKKLIDYSISKKKTPFFIQTHGISYEEVNGAARNIKIKGEALNENKIYSAAADNYMAAGGAEDNIIKNLSDDKKVYSDKLIRDLVIDYIKSRGKF
jgi:2',3'-cyclic-nucleotide 2'-phosphodiesterase (5'-nucleotidase family)